jgi:hypothetical protein
VIGAVAVAAVLVLLLAYGQRWWQGDGGSFAPAKPVARATVSPRSALFGDTLKAQVELLVDPRQVDPSSIELAPVFAPFKIVSELRSQGDGPGRSQVVRFTYAIQCLSVECVPLMVQGKGAARETRSIQLRPPRVTAKAPNGLAVRIPVTWPTFVLHSRLSGPEIEIATPEVAPTFTPPKPSWRVTPDTAGAAALVLAVLLVLGAAWILIAPLARDSRRLRVPRIPKHLTPVERALRLAEHAAVAGEPEEERKALQRLAVELERQGSVELAGRAGRLAWSEGDPTPDTVGALAGDVRGNGAH